MNYYLFFQDWQDNLYQIGFVEGTGKEEGEVVQELWNQIAAYLEKERPERKVHYYNIWNTNGFTTVDFGSHSEFFRIRPVVSMA